MAPAQAEASTVPGNLISRASQPVPLTYMLSKILDLGDVHFVIPRTKRLERQRG